jgi:diacylglycerol kinase (ATP)
MRAAAVLGPGIKPSNLEPFRLPGVELENFSSANTQALDALLIFGGDGTLHHELPFLAASKTPLLIVPTGSGNDFAHGLGIRTADDALELWRRFISSAAQLRELDLGVIRAGNSPERYFCNVASLGLDAAANRVANKFPRWLRGHGGYLLAAIVAIVSDRTEKIRLLTRKDGTEWDMFADERATLVAIANGPTYGGGIRIAPNAENDDGRLDICFVRAAGLWRLLHLFRRVLRAEHGQMREVRFLHTEHLRIETAMPKEIYADGEFAGITPAEFSVLPRALRVIAP